MKRFAWRFVLVVAIVVAAGVLAACPAEQDEPAAPPSTEAPVPMEPERPEACVSPCGDDCSNQPFERTDCWTTTYGPARADVLTGPTNMLLCDASTYALCFYSGPWYPTGTTPAENAPLPCVEGEKEGFASCTCEVQDGVSFVDIHAILNLGAYFETVELCGPEGKDCRNLSDCTPGGPRGEPSCDFGDKPEAPVCGYVAAQNPDDPAVSLIPGADLISTFGFSMVDDYGLGSLDCTADGGGSYAGCMTAPCWIDENDPALARCECPVWDGPFQVGQSFAALPDPQSMCQPGEHEGASYVWSASYSAPGPKAVIAAWLESHAATSEP